MAPFLSDKMLFFSFSPPVFHWLNLIRNQLLRNSGKYHLTWVCPVIQSRAGEGLGVIDLRANRLMTIKESKHLEICYNSALIWFLMEDAHISQVRLTSANPLSLP